jgi:molybdopterin-guanine dinucleotide biosynthesis protein A
VGHLAREVSATGARCTGVLLAGGRATRMGGRPKGLERVGGYRIIDRAAAALRAASDDLLLVANAPEADHWLPGVRVATDRRLGVGALGGIHAALEDAGTDVLVLSWDAPFVPGALLRAMRDASAGHDAVVPVSESPWGFEPLCAWYAHRCLPVIERHLDAGSYSAGGWLPDVHALTFDASPFGASSRIFYNVNSPDDLRHAETLL